MDDIELKVVLCLMKEGISQPVARELWQHAMHCYREGTPLDAATEQALAPLRDGRWLKM